MTLRTFYAYPGEAPRQIESGDAGDGLRHGFTIADLHKAARAAVIADRSRGMDQSTAYDIAWEGICLHLMEATQAPHYGDLVRAGWQAIYAEIRQGNRMRGIPEADRRYELDTSPRFAQYWGRLVQPGHETAIVERLALAQILPALTHTQQQGLAALAARGDYQDAADFLGIDYKALIARVGYARRKFLSCWFEHETPPRARRTDRRVGSRSQPKSTHCPQGHEWTPENTRWDTRMVKGTVRRGRRCRACQRERDARRRITETQGGTDA